MKTKKMERSLALDVFRGMTVVLMILVNNPGSWSFIYPPFEHAHWHGLTPTDLVFPFFLFAVGNAQALVLPRLKESNQFFSKVLKRSFLIFAIGLFLNWFPGFVWVGDSLTFKSWTWINAEGTIVGLRVMGVLQRIALAYGASAILVYFFEKRLIWIIAGVLLSYWGLCHLLASGDVYSLQDWFGTEIDKMVFGHVHLYQGEGVAFDPEGLVSTLPCIAQVLIGYLVGKKISQTGKTGMNKMILHGIGILVLGIIWNFFHPVNKKIWTGSYVLVTSGLAMLLLSLQIWVLDIKKYRGKIASFFESCGKNPLFIYVLSLFVPKLMSLIRIPAGEKFLTPLQWFYGNVCAKFLGDVRNGSLLYAILIVAAYGAICVYLDKKKIYIKV